MEEIIKRLSEQLKERGSPLLPVRYRFLLLMETWLELKIPLSKL